MGVGTLLRRTKSRIRWICATCQTQHRDNRAKRCRVCKITDLPLVAFLHVEVAAKGQPKKYREGDPLRAMSRRGREMVRLLAEEKERRGLGKYAAAISLPKVFAHLREPRRIPRRTTWFTQVFAEGFRYAGELPVDICHMGVVGEIVSLMAARRMVQFRIPADLHIWFKRYAARKGVTMTDLMIAHIEKLRRADENATRVEQI